MVGRQEHKGEVEEKKCCVSHSRVVCKGLIRTLFDYIFTHSTCFAAYANVNNAENSHKPFNKVMKSFNSLVDYSSFFECLHSASKQRISRASDQ